MAVETELLPPRYRDPVPIGKGGMGEIFRATDETLGRTVAIKVLSERHARDEGVRDRFKREALAAARLSSDPNIVTIFDVGEWDERPFIVMEYLDGGSLDDRLRSGGAQEPGQALEWLDCAAKALDAAHADGVVHRDVKPGNLLLDRQGSCHVADFGIASATGMDSLTATGTVLGTAGYLAPEQAKGGRATPASDRYALAVVAFELLTGVRPFAGDTPAAEAAAHVHGDIPTLSERRPDLPEELDDVFVRALAKDPNERYPSCADFVADLRHALHVAAGTTRPLPSVAATPPPVEPAPAGAALPPAEPPAAVRRRRPVPLGPALALLALLGLVIAGIAVGAALTGGDDEPRRQAAQPRERVRTVTEKGRTVEITVTAPAEPSGGTEGQGGGGSGGSGGSASSLGEAIQLNDQATGLMRGGDYASALPLAERALARLRGTGHRYEAYAEYNVGRSLIELGRCEEGLPHIDRSEELQGHRSEFDVARAKCD